MSDLSNDMINQLRQNTRSVVRELGLLNDAYFKIGVTLAERHLLIELSTTESPTMGEIAERLLVDKSTVSRLISKATKKGYIKCLQGEGDKRKRFLQLTQKGFQTLRAFEPIAFNQTKEALLTLTDKEIQVVYQGIAFYAQGLKNSRLHEKRAPVQQKSQKKKILKLAEIRNRLHELGYVLKPFEQKDDKSLHKIFQEVVDAGSQFPYEDSSFEGFHRQFFQPVGQVYVCHTLGGKVIGGFYLRPNFPGRSSHIANAAYMIKEEYRGKGIGSLLIQASLHFAKDLGFQAMQFNMVLSNNRLAIKLYENLGFNSIGTIPQAFRNPDASFQDGYVMHRKLDDI